MYCPSLVHSCYCSIGKNYVLKQVHSESIVVKYKSLRSLFATTNCKQFLVNYMYMYTREFFSGATFQVCLHENNILKFVLHWTLCKFMGLFFDFRGLFWAFRGLNPPEPPCIFFTDVHVSLYIWFLYSLSLVEISAIILNLDFRSTLVMTAGCVSLWRLSLLVLSLSSFVS